MIRAGKIANKPVVTALLTLTKSAVIHNLRLPDSGNCHTQHLTLAYVKSFLRSEL